MTINRTPGRMAVAEAVLARAEKAIDNGVSPEDVTLGTFAAAGALAFLHFDADGVAAMMADLAADAAATAREAAAAKGRRH